MNVKKILFDVGRGGASRDFGLLLMRVVFGGSMLLGHGWRKLVGFSELSGGFPDPLGLGSPVSLSLAVFGEVFAPLALIVGFMGRVSAIPAAITMVVAAFLHHAGDPFKEKELALLYLAAFAVLAITGPGRFSIDRLIRSD